MPPDSIDFSRRTQPADLPERMDQPCSREELRACLRDLAWINRVLLGYRPTFHWLDTLRLERFHQPIRILDVGCGGGDMLRRIERWAAARAIPVELMGLDINAECIAIASETTGASSRIHWAAGDVFSYVFPAPPHLVISSLVTHHLADAELVRFLRWMEQNAEVGWFINDLSRAPIPYHLLGLFARVMRLHPFVQHDGPVSIARAFQADDWQRLCAEARLNENDVTIRAWMPARLSVARNKK